MLCSHCNHTKGDRKQAYLVAQLNTPGTVHSA